MLMYVRTHHLTIYGSQLLVYQGSVVVSKCLIVSFFDLEGESGCGYDKGRGLF